MSSSSIFSSEIVKKYNSNNKKNPFDLRKLSKADSDLLEKLLEAATAKNNEDLEYLRSKIGYSELTGDLKWRSEQAQRVVEGLLFEAGRNKSQVWFGMIDLDVLKKLNDTFGYTMADKVLLALSKAIKTGTRKSDMSFQFGVDEFPILLLGITKRGLPGVVHRISVSFKKRIEGLAKEGEIDKRMVILCSFSAGFAQAQISEDFGERGYVYQTPTEMFDKATKGLHLAKKAGKNRVHFEGDDRPVVIV